MSMFVLRSICFFFSLFFFSIVYSTTTGGAGWDATGPTREAIETQDETGGETTGRGVNVRVILLFVLCSVYFFFSLFFFSIVYSTATDRAGWNVMGPADSGGTATQHGTRGQARGKRK